MSFRRYKVTDTVFSPLYFRCFILRRLGSHYTFGYHAYAFCFFMFPTILRYITFFSLLTMSVLDEGESISASCALISYPRLYLHRPIAISAMLNAWASPRAKSINLISFTFVKVLTNKGKICAKDRRLDHHVRQVKPVQRES